MAEAYIKVKAENLQPGDFILIPPAKGRHRSHGAVDGSSHRRVWNVYVSNSGKGWVDVFFDGSGITLSAGYMVSVVPR
jgi:hypothetical protein